MNDRTAVVVYLRLMLAGSTHLGLQADGEGWGLRNTRRSHMSPNHTEPLGGPQFASKCAPWEIGGQSAPRPDSDQVLGNLILCVCLRRNQKTIGRWWKGVTFCLVFGLESKTQVEYILPVIYTHKQCLFVILIGLWMTRGSGQKQTE